ncbi:CDGSH iron-sulfur domain-containing protein [Kitasatospora aburaviensis]
MSGSTERAVSGSPDRAATRVVVVPGGPLLVEGPVEVVLPDGTVRTSERPVVALCTCRRSRRYPSATPATGGAAAHGGTEAQAGVRRRLE